MEQQNPATFRAALISRFNESLIPNNLLIPDHKLYFCALDRKIEGHYLCGFLNSQPVLKWLGGFLLNKQIGTSIFEYANIPRFDPKNTAHLRIAEISGEAHAARKVQKTDALLQPTTEKELAHLVIQVTRGKTET